ncbi:macrolide-efflux protein [Anaeramoeba flamelloides]|uniref:Macrolide-efflux protein n=1 Tax=Anaeramoeba flamelloides TaxID=1746091 RepID=A0ABQ8X2B7_9EUKA|nr:macrolide-efflux protein [Anaeramoeba flamelloides]
MGTFKNYKNLLTNNKAYLFLWLGLFASLFGDWFNQIATIVLCQGLESDEMYLSYLFVARTLPSFLLIPFVNSIVDRFNKNFIMITSDLIRAALVLLFILVKKVENIWFLLGIIFVQFSVSSFFLPARTAIIAKIVNKNNIVLANTFDSATWSALYFIGSSIGGIVADYAGLTWAFIIDSITYLISSICVYISLKAYRNRVLTKGKIINNNSFYSNSPYESLMGSSSESEKKEENTHKRGTKLKNIILDIEEEEKEHGESKGKKKENREEEEAEETEEEKEIEEKKEKEDTKEQKKEKDKKKDGFLESVRFLKRNPHTFAILCVKSTGALIWGAITILIIQIIEQHFKINKSVSIPIGILYASEGIGSMISPLVAEHYFKKTTGKRWFSIFLGFVLFEIGLAVLIFGSYLENFYIFVAGNVIRAGGIGLIWVFSTVLIQHEKPEMIGRLFGFDYGFFFLCIMISYLWGGFGINLKLNSNTILQIQFLVGVFIICCWIIYLLKRKKKFKHKILDTSDSNSNSDNDNDNGEYDGNENKKSQEKRGNTNHVSKDESSINAKSNSNGSSNGILNNEFSNNPILNNSSSIDESSKSDQN